MWQKVKWVKRWKQANSQAPQANIPPPPLKLDLSTVCGWPEGQALDKRKANMAKGCKMVEIVGNRDIPRLHEQTPPSPPLKLGLSRVHWVAWPAYQVALPIFPSSTGPQSNPEQRILKLRQDTQGQALDKRKAKSGKRMRDG